MRPQTVMNEALRQFVSSHDVSRTTKSLGKSLLQLKEASLAHDIEGQVDLLGEIIVSCLGALEALGCDTEEVLRRLCVDGDETGSALARGPSVRIVDPTAR
jgi:hypothetical protein